MSMCEEGDKDVEGKMFSEYTLTSECVLQLNARLTEAQTAADKERKNVGAAIGANEW